MAFRAWFPLSLQKQALFFKNFTKVFIEIAASMNFTAADIEKLEADNAVMQYLAQTEILLNSYRKSFRLLKKDLTRGRGNAEPAYLPFIAVPAPPIVPFGIFDRLFHLADRIAAAEGYTTATGAELGILPKSKEPLRTEDLQLRLRIKPLAEARIEARFVRGRTNGVNLYCRRAGDEQWFDLGRFFYSPAIVQIPLLEAGKPEQVQIRGRYLLGNEAVGNSSPISSVIITP